MNTHEQSQDQPVSETPGRLRRFAAYLGLAELRLEAFDSHPQPDDRDLTEWPQRIGNVPSELQRLNDIARSEKKRQLP